MQAYKTAQGNWQVNFSERGKQRTLYLGRDFTLASADRIAKIVTDILSHRKRGERMPVEICRKIESLPVRVRKSFERHGLVGGVSCWSVGDLLKSFYESKSHLKVKTQNTYKMFGNRLLEFFGEERRLDSIERLDCEGFKNQRFGKFSPCTLSTGVRRCRAIFAFAVKSKWISENPFVGLVSRVDVNLDRQYYVDRETIYRVMEHCRDDHDRLLLALARFGGLRIPSEIRQLRYCDFSDRVIHIHKDTKTGARDVPFFGEIREIFERLTQAGLSKCNPADLVFGDLGSFRKRILAVIRASGVKRWEKLFINLRSSCITDMSEQGYSEKMLDSMFGNSARIRSKHYVQFRKDREYAKVLEDNERLLKILRDGGTKTTLSEEEIRELLVSTVTATATIRAIIELIP